MWGGWFDDARLMAEIAEMKKIYDTGLVSNDETLSAEVVFFADEESYANVFTDSPQISGIYGSRIAIGKSGVPYDTYAVEDAKEILHRYKAAIFPFCIPSDTGKVAMRKCEELGIPYLCATAEHPELSLGEIREFLEKSGVNLYAPVGEVVYAGCGYLGLHSSVGGKKELRLPRKMRVSAALGAGFEEEITDCVSFEMKENDTVLFTALTP